MLKIQQKILIKTVFNTSGLYCVQNQS